MAELDANIYVSLDQLASLRLLSKGFSFLPRQPVQSILSGRHASRLRGRGLNFEELRHYRPGDDIRTLDWKVTRRLRKPHVRVYTEEKERSVMLLIDQRMSMFFGSREQMKSVVAAQLAAIAGWRALASGDRVGAIVFNDDGCIEFPPRRSHNHFLRILRAVVDANQALRVGRQAKPDVLNTALLRCSKLIKHDALTCLITDLNGADSHTEKMISRLSAHNDIVLGFVYDAMEQNLPRGGKLVVSDGELQIEIDSTDTDLRQRFQEDFDQRLEQARRFLQKRGVPTLPLHCHGDVLQQVRQLLSHPPAKDPVLVKVGR